MSNQSRRQRQIQRVSAEINELVAKLNSLLLEEQLESEEPNTPRNLPIATPVPFAQAGTRRSSPRTSTVPSSQSFSDLDRVIPDTLQSIPTVFATPFTPRNQPSTPRRNRNNRRERSNRQRSNSHTIRSRSSRSSSSSNTSLQEGDLIEFTNNYRGLRGARGYISNIGTAFITARLIGRHSNLGLTNRHINNVRRVRNNN